MFLVILSLWSCGGKAQELLEAANNGDAEAQHKLGLLYYVGQGVPQDYQEARKWFEKAAAQNNVDGQYSLGFLYSKGQGVPQDYQEARKWYEKAAAQGDAQAQHALELLDVIEGRK